MLRNSNSHLVARSEANGNVNWVHPEGQCKGAQQEQKEEGCHWRLVSLELVGLHKGTVFVALVNQAAQATELFWIDLGTGVVQQQERAPFAAIGIPLPLADLMTSRLSFYMVNECSGSVEGFVPVPLAPPTGETVEMEVQLTWSVNFAAEKQTILTVAASMQRSLRQVPVFVHADVSVGYKHIDPNLLAVVTAEEGVGGALVLHLLNGVSGQLVHQQVLFSGASKPLTVAVCEDSVYVHFWNIFDARFELLVVSLTENRPDPGPLGLIFPSSRRSPHKSGFSLGMPSGEARNYILPSSVSALGITATAQGITPKALVLASASTQQIYLLSTRLASAKRPLPAVPGGVPSDAAAAGGIPDGMIGYTPILPLNPADSLTYGRTVAHVRGVHSEPSERESSSLVFAFGMDLFFSPVQPAGNPMEGVAGISEHHQRQVQEDLATSGGSSSTRGGASPIHMLPPVAEATTTTDAEVLVSTPLEETELCVKDAYYRLPPKDGGAVWSALKRCYAWVCCNGSRKDRAASVPQSKDFLSESGYELPTASYGDVKTAPASGSDMRSSGTCRPCSGGLHKREGKLVLSGISCRFPPHQVTAILGGSGAGKSTLLSLLAGRLKPDLSFAKERKAAQLEVQSRGGAGAPHQGEGSAGAEGARNGGSGSGAAAAPTVLTLAEDLELAEAEAEVLLLNGVKAPKGWRRLVGFCLQQDLLLLQQLTVEQTLLLEAKLRLGKVLNKHQRKQRVEKVIQMMNLEKCRHTIVGSPFSRGLSGGERRRLSVACELLLPKPLLQLDEPTSGLDAPAAAHLLRLLQQVARENGTAVICTIHQPSPQLFLSFDRVMFLAEGRVVFAGAPQQLRAYEAALFGMPVEENRALLAAPPDAVGVAFDGGDMHFSEVDAAAAREAASPTRPDCCVAEHFLAVACGVGVPFTTNILVAHLKRLLLVVKQQRSSQQGASGVAASQHNNNVGCIKSLEFARGDDLIRGIEAVLQQVEGQRQHGEQHAALRGEAEQKREHAENMSRLLDVIFRVYRHPTAFTLRDDFQTIAAASLRVSTDVDEAAGARENSPEGASREIDISAAKTTAALGEESNLEDAVATGSNSPTRLTAAVPTLQQVAVHPACSCSEDGGAVANFSSKNASVTRRHQALVAATAAVRAASSPLLQFEVLLQRHLMSEFRGTAFATDVGQAVLLGIIIGSIYSKRMANYTTEALHDRIALLYFVCEYHLFNPAFTALSAFPAIRAAAAAGSSSKLFGTSLWLCLLLVSVLASSIGQLVATAAGSDYRVGALLLAVTLITLVLVGGFHAALPSMPLWIRWLAYVSPVSYVIPNLLHITIGDRYITCSSSLTGLGGDMGCTGQGLTAADIASNISIGLPVVVNVFVLLLFVLLVKSVTLVLLKGRLQIQN
ncbi:hypothetical protein cyc_03056 [Cyclospora cayetanensis]|uniref:ABC transporter domain-containing protein n=1 Tax=Cyclospora cayetanensis TaxID=88456 RepID=A0A1D3CTL2_9EIME|nr:hypothetical protein cyc_03056 [Cyclospora cayetanensis]